MRSETIAGNLIDLGMVGHKTVLGQAAHDKLNSLIREGDELVRPLQRAVRDEHHL